MKRIAALLGLCCLLSPFASATIETNEVDVDYSTQKKVKLKIPQGEQRAFFINYQTNGANTILNGYTSDYLYTYRGTTNWYQIVGTTDTNAGTVRILWTPTVDPGKLKYSGWVRLVKSADTSFLYRCQIDLQMLETPGFAPNPTGLTQVPVDFATLNFTNVPSAWLTNEQHEARITSNELAIAALSSASNSFGPRVIALEFQNTSNEQDIVILEAQNVSNELDIAVLVLQVGSNDADVVSLQAQITSNDLEIAAYVLRIASNESWIVTHTFQIATNAADIVDLQAQNASNEVVLIAYTNFYTSTWNPFNIVWTNFYDTEWVAYTNVARGGTNVMIDGVGGTYNLATRTITVLATNNLLRSGTRPLTGNMNYGGFRGTNAAAGIATNDLVIFQQLTVATNAINLLSWHINGDNYPTGPMNVGAQALTNVAYMTLVSTNLSGNSIEAAGGIEMKTGTLNLHTNKITYLEAGTDPLDGVNLTQLIANTNAIAVASLSGGNNKLLATSGVGAGQEIDYTPGPGYPLMSRIAVLPEFGGQDMNMSSNKITYLADGIATNDAINLFQLQDATNAIDNAWLKAMFTDAYLTDGTRNMSDDIVFSANKVIRRNTSSGSDNGVVGLYGGGASSAGRIGGGVLVCGPEFGMPGVDIFAEENGEIRFKTMLSIDRMKIASNGVVTVSESLYADAYKIDVNSTNSAAFQWWAVSNRFAIVQIIGGFTNVTFVSPE